MIQYASRCREKSKPNAFFSLDAFRGFDMLMISGVDVVVIALARFLLGGDGGWLAAQMGHPELFGLTFYDTISPTFLFISGISFPSAGASPTRFGAGSCS